MERKEIRKELKEMKLHQINHYEKYCVMKLATNRYAFSFADSNLYDYECDYVGTVGLNQAIDWIVEQ